AAPAAGPKERAGRRHQLGTILRCRCAGRVPGGGGHFSRSRLTPSRLRVQPAFNHRLLELTSLPGARLADAHGLSAMVVAAAGAVGMPTLGPPMVRDGPGGIVIALLCREGHIVLHT